ncbi:MAG TPA: TlpA disulfide reductase family protein [Myxococcota bacterium]|nr:TlpA disulfide reductase family protein [Myxococcota bacterium]
MLVALMLSALAQTPGGPPPAAPPGAPPTAAPKGPEMIPLEALDQMNKPAPEFELDTLAGGKFKLADHRGKPVVLSFWASWCGPCRQELPALSELQKQRSDVEIIAVNVDRDPKLAQRFLASVKVELPIVWDPDAIALGQYEVLSMPTMFLLDKGLVMRFRKTGFSAERGLTELIAALDGKPAPAPPGGRP